jgi:hypothetical protein
LSPQLAALLPRGVSVNATIQGAMYVMFGSVVFWFFLCSRLFKILKNRHPEQYQRMGSPSLVLNNTISNNFLFLKFLVGRGWRPLNDTTLSRLGGFMLVFLCAYLMLFAGVIYAMFKGYAQ